MANVEEIRKKLAACRSFIEPYSGYGEMVVKTIEDFKKMEELMKEPTKENAAKTLQILEEVEARIGPYGSYIPDVMENIKFVKEELKKI
ncbi:hypothetical protein DRO56_05410 [Candidatus Bathyarchaeota archaeon]|nr:hypothetical protein [Candidatus Bathyarchaeota archaeon]RJS88735.1 MAG: hypothetical protein CW700_06895 [Candidatus Bathyarchaeota archaeon]RLI31204.1 MAG: hypothetical protein DRO56_05410 [Candidatus Bathyarchaeota archaeon]